MRPIRDISDVRPDSVLYHSAFGFARVVGVRDTGVQLQWERAGENLPEHVSAPNLSRVYALCNEKGFFHCAMLDPEKLQEMLLFDPPAALELLLEDLVGPQRRQDLRDWVVGRNLMTERAFDRWWETLEPQIAEDDRFEMEHDTVALHRRDEPSGAVDRLANPLLSPGRRLDLALIHRDELGEEAFRDHALRSWCNGGKQVKDLAMAAMRDVPAGEVLDGLLARGPDSIDALIHAIRRSGWEAHEVGAEVRTRLVGRILEGTEQGGPLDSEGRLAAALTRWGAPEAVPALASLAETPDGQQLIRATLATLPPRRAEELALDLQEVLIQEQERLSAANWLGAEILMRAGEDLELITARLAESRPGVAQWFRTNWDPRYGDDFTEDGFTAEVVEITETLPIGERSSQSPHEFLGLGLAFARSLSHEHNAGRVVNPTRLSVLVHPDGNVELKDGNVETHSPRPMGEAPSQAGDVHAAAVLLLEGLLGKPWPRNIPAHRVIPFVRQIVPNLPAAALAPLDAALHPTPTRRPSDGLSWLVRWQSAAVAEDSRMDTAVNDQLRLRIGYDSHVGRLKLLHTQTNQDALFVSARGPLHLMVVCDGISTATAGSGDIAAGIAVHVVANLWEQALSRLNDATQAEVFDFIDRALRMANQAVCEAALRYAGGRLDGRVPMGTTALVAIARGNQVCLGWLGDSRAYLVGPYGTAILTADQNQAGDRLLSWTQGHDPYWDPAGFALVGYIGHFNEWNRAEPLPVAHLAFTMLHGEKLAMCTDGVTDYLADTHPELGDVMAELLRGDDPDELARELVNQANRGGGGDNATAIVTSLWRPA
jgi:serine/threonine protein phosphatase PrpC